MLVPYTPAVASQNANMQALAQSAVDSANQGYVNSQINAQARLVGIMSTTYVEKTGTTACSGFDTTAFDNALCDVTNGNGALSGVAARRDQLGADIVAMLIDDNAFCGLGWVNSAANRAFSITSHTCITNLSFQHEIGHNFGALHDPYVEPSNNPFAYGHGKVNNVAGNRFRTVMAYNNQCADAGTSCTRVNYFSNPNVNYNGTATGDTTTRNNARVHNERIATVAAFRAAVAGSSPLAAAVLPASRSVQVGTPATAFATIINTGAAATGCNIAPGASVPATFSFQTTNSSNQLTGSPNTAVSIPQNGSQSFVFAFTPTSAMTPTNVPLTFACTGVSAAPSVVGLNTILLSFSTTPSIRFSSAFNSGC